MKIEDIFSKAFGYEGVLTASHVVDLISYLKAQCCTELEVTCEEFYEIARVFAHDVPWDWDGESIWGIKLIKYDAKTEGQ